MSKSTKWFLIILGILAVVVCAVSLLLFRLVSESVDRTETITRGSGDKIAVVELKGVISSSEEIVRQLKKYREQRAVLAILLRIDSPGGGVVASQEMYEEVRKTRESGKPVVVSMGSLAASGGYYVACGGTRIVANRGTLTGSIGVISEFLQLEELFGKIGVDVKTIKAGKLKDAGTPTRKMTDADQRYFQELMDDVHRQFIAVVERERKLNHEAVVAVADGRVFTGEHALELGLVDTIGTYEDAIEITAAIAGIEGQPSIVKERRHRGLLDALTSGVAAGWTSLKQDILERRVLPSRLAGPQ